MKHPMSRSYWLQLKALIKQDLAGVTENDLVACHGRRDRLLEKLQDIYGISTDEAEGAVRYYEHQIAMCYSRKHGGAGRVARWDAYQNSSANSDARS